MNKRDGLIHSPTRSTTTRLPAAVNYHLNRHCNYHCRHCYAVFNDAPIVRGAMLPSAAMFRIVELVARAPMPAAGRQRKLTFAGGEPTLVPWLPELIAFAREQGLVTMLVTNGSRLTPAYLDRLTGHLDWLTLSIDGLDAETNRRIGRADSQGATLTLEDHLRLSAQARVRGMRIKMNTVVNRHNAGADFSNFLLRLAPERWKVLQVMPVAGQNDTHYEEAKCTSEEFAAFVARHESLARRGLTVVPEAIEDIRGSYAMIDPQGRFFDSTTGRHTYSDPILHAGLAAAFAQVQFSHVLFRERGGDYEFSDTARSGGETGSNPRS